MEEAAKKDGEVIDLSGAVGIESSHVEAEEDCDSDAEVELLKKVCTETMMFEAPPVEDKKKGKKRRRSQRQRRTIILTSDFAPLNVWCPPFLAGTPSCIAPLTHLNCRVGLFGMPAWTYFRTGETFFVENTPYLRM